MSTKDFFKVQSASSRIKAKIVAEYFPQYARIILKRNQEKIIYLDLFSGPGLYEDGSPSTPILLAELCARDQILKSKVQLMFNDNQYGQAIEENFLERFPPGTFSISPRFASKTVGKDKTIQDYLSRPPETKNPSPTLLFFDPWGYKGIDTATLATFLDNWGNELFLFINIKRIHAAIKNDKFEELMRALFPKSFDKLKEDRKYTANVYERLNLIMNNIAEEFSLHCKGKLFCSAFKFQEEDSTATSHFIVHFTKHSRGYELVKQTYFDFDNIGSVLESEGVYTYDAKNMGSSKTSDSMFGDLNVHYLSKDLESTFKGQTLSARSLFDKHQISTKYCASHYAKTLRDMVEKGKINAKFTDDKTHKVSVLINENCILTFS